MAARRSGAVGFTSEEVSVRLASPPVKVRRHRITKGTIPVDVRIGSMGKAFLSYSSPRYSNRFAKTLVDRLARGEVIAKLPGRLLLAALK